MGLLMLLLLVLHGSGIECNTVYGKVMVAGLPRESFSSGKSEFTSVTKKQPVRSAYCSLVAVVPRVALLHMNIGGVLT